MIGIPMKTSDLGGVDSLYSIVQMPSGIPVATVAIDGRKTPRFLQSRYSRFRMKRFRTSLWKIENEDEDEVIEKDKKLQLDMQM